MPGSSRSDRSRSWGLPRASCLDANLLFDLAAGRVHGTDRERWVAHLDVCSSCLDFVIMARREDALLFAQRYRRDSVPLGIGASAAVYPAFDVQHQRWVALKLLHPHLCGSPRLERLLEAEQRFMSISHPNVCPVLDGGRVDDQVFLVTELAQHSLAEELARPGVDWTERLGDFAQIVAGTAALHTAGVVHRDLKPENILRMADGRLAVADFGLAVLACEKRVTPWVGTQGYLAPERVLALGATPAADVWSLGAILYQMLFACRPVWSRANVPPSVRASSDTPQLQMLEQLSLQCMSYAASQRPHDASVVAGRFEAIRTRGAASWHAARSVNELGPRARFGPRSR
jgi:serine/threonine protein kinase